VEQDGAGPCCSSGLAGGSPLQRSRSASSGPRNGRGHVRQQRCRGHRTPSVRPRLRRRDANRLTRIWLPAMGTGGRTHWPSAAERQLWRRRNRGLRAPLGRARLGQTAHAAYRSTRATPPASARFTDYRSEAGRWDEAISVLEKGRSTAAPMGRPGRARSRRRCGRRPSAGGERPVFPERVPQRFGSSA
jgi:hypothetical protein